MSTSPHNHEPFSSTTPSETGISYDLPVDEEKQETGTEPEEDHIVQWDGDNDPLSPRSMSVLRKWLILIVVANGSLLVQVTP